MIPWQAEQPSDGLLVSQALIFLPRIKEFERANSQFPRDVHCASSAACFGSGLKTACCRGQGWDVHRQSGCCLERSSAIEFHRKTAGYCGQLSKPFLFRLTVECYLRLEPMAFKGSFRILRKKVTFLQFSC